MSALRDLAAGLDMEPEPGAAGEMHATCSEERFAPRVAALAEGAILADLFATTGERRRRLSAVFEAAGDPGWLVLHCDLSSDSFTSVTPLVHSAAWYEREIREMHGLEPLGHPMPARLRLLDWPEGVPPMRAGPGAAARGEPSEPERVPVVRGRGVFQIPLGPVRSGPQESGEFLFNSGGEDLVAVSPLLGYKLRAVERLAEGRSPEEGLVLAERLAGVSAFANGLAYAQAVERSLGIRVGPRQRAARSLLNELERLHNHLGDIGRLAEATGLMVAAAQYAALKEEVLRAGADLTAHRYLRGALSIGGLSAPLPSSGLHGLRRALPGWHRRTERMRVLLEATGTFTDRLETTARLRARYAAAHNLVGPVGRSAAVDRDCRRDHPYAAYEELRFEVPVRPEGDAQARLAVRIEEVRQSLGILDQLLEAGFDRERSGGGEPETARHEALGWCEGAGGQTLHWVELDADARIVRWRARPPAFVNWHVYSEACASGNNLTDHPVIEASFALSHAEFDR